MSGFNFQTVFHILYETLAGNTSIKKNYTEIFFREYIRKTKILSSCPMPAALFEASRFIATVLVCADYENRFSGKTDQKVFLNIDFMHLDDAEEPSAYPVYLYRIIGRCCLFI